MGKTLGWAFMHQRRLMPVFCSAQPHRPMLIRATTLRLCVRSIVSWQPLPPLPPKKPRACRSSSPDSLGENRRGLAQNQVLFLQPLHLALEPQHFCLFGLAGG